MKLFHKLLFYFILCSATGVMCLELITTKYIQAEPESQVTVKCSTNQSLPLASCQFRIWYNGLKEAGDVIDVTGNRDPALIKNVPTPNTTFTAVSSGTNFATGDCGVTLTGMRANQLLVGCKLTTESGDSALRTAPLFVAARNKLELTDNSEALHISLGGNVSFGLKAKHGNQTLRKCYISKLNGVPVTVTIKSPIFGGGRYQAWLEDRECKFTILDVNESDDRTIYLVAEGVGGKTTGAKVITLVLEQDLEMQLDKRLEDSKVGDHLKATCSARVVPDQDLVWSWRLGNQGYGEDNRPISVRSASWRWPWETAVVSDSRDFVLTADDHDKNISCTLGALFEGNNLMDQSTSKRLNFEMPTTATTASPTSPTSATSATSATSTVCPALSTRSVRVRCSLSGSRVDCAKAPAPRGTSALVRCRAGFRPPGVQPDFHVANCSEGGRWQPNPIECELDCGRRKDGGHALSIGGKGADPSEFPWHVAVFKKEHDETYTLSCGGSLVTLKFFVSAAHCFWSNSERKKMRRSLFKASLGKHTLSWTTLDDYEQRRSLKEVHLPAHFAGYTRRLESDIALVQLMAPVEVTPSVNVVCLHWGATVDDGKLTATSMGSVPGWGLTEHNVQSPTLRFVDLPFVPYEDCLSTTPLGFQDYLLRDKMCGGFHNRSTSVCTGDSGGGFVFPEGRGAKRQYFLRGVVSGSPGRQGEGALICQAEHRTTFTKVWVFLKWMHDLVTAEEAAMEDY